VAIKFLPGEFSEDPGMSSGFKAKRKLSVLSIGYSKEKGVF